MPKCHYYPLSYARTDKKDIFAYHFTENIYKIKQIKQTDYEQIMNKLNRQNNVLHSFLLLELGKLTLG